MPPPQKKFFSLEMAHFDAFRAVLFVRVLARKLLIFPPDEVIWWTMKMYFWEIVNTLLELWG